MIKSTMRHVYIAWTYYIVLARYTPFGTILLHVFKLLSFLAMFGVPNLNFNPFTTEVHIWTSSSYEHSGKLTLLFAAFLFYEYPRERNVSYL